MSGLAQQLIACESPFLVGFGQGCLDDGLSDDQARRRLKIAMATLPAVKVEVQELLTKQAARLNIGSMLGGLKDLSSMLSRAKPMTSAPGVSGAFQGLRPGAAGMSSSGLRSTYWGAASQAAGKAPAAGGVRAGFSVAPGGGVQGSVLPRPGLQPGKTPVSFGVQQTGSPSGPMQLGVRGTVGTPSSSTAVPMPAGGGGMPPGPGAAGMGGAGGSPSGWGAQLGRLNNPWVRGGIGAGIGAMTGSQNGGGYMGAATDAMLGGLVGAKAPGMGMPLLMGHGIGQQFGINLSPGSNLGRGVSGAQYQLGYGGPTFRQGIDPNTNDIDALTQQLHSGADELRQAGQSWQDHGWSNGSYGKQIADQRSKLYGQFRDRAKSMGADPSAIESTLGNYTPQVTGNLSDIEGLSRQLQDPEIRQQFGSRLDAMEQQIGQALKDRKPVDPQQATDLMTSRAVMTALEQGKSPTELAQQASQTMQTIMQDGQISPQEVPQLFQSKAGQEFAQTFAGQGGFPDMNSFLSGMGEWATSNPMQAGLLMLGIPMALWGAFSSMSGGGMGGMMALLGGLGLAAGGAGMFGGAGLPGMGGGQGGQGGAVGRFATQAPGTDTWAAHYGQQVAQPGGDVQLFDQFSADPRMAQMGQLINTPEKLKHFVTTYNQQPEQANQWLKDQTIFDSKVDANWPQIVGHMNSPHGG